MAKIVKAPATKSAKKPATAKKGPVILSAPKGYRVLTHKQIKDAVKAVIAERTGTDG